MRHRTTVVLMILFLAGVCVLWWADYSAIPDRARHRELLNRILPELIDTPVAEINRIEIDRKGGPVKGRIVAERRGEREWQLLEPIDAAADAELVETLARNLKDLRKSPDAGTIGGDPSPYGLAQPEGAVKVYVKGKKTPEATLDLGLEKNGRLYVRPGDATTGIEVVDKGPLTAWTLPALKWRDTVVFHVPSFRVKDVSILESKANQKILLRRDDRRWRLEKPFKVPADGDKVEGLVAELSALRLTNGDASFVADDVRDLSPYGLDNPAMSITVTPFEGSGKPQTLLLGKGVPDKAENVYAMRGDQNDVIQVDVKRLREAIPGANGLRSQTVLDLKPDRIDRLRITTRDKNLFDLALTPTGWKRLGPTVESADRSKVQTLLTQLADLKASTFLEPSQVNDPRLNNPYFHIVGWESSSTSNASAAEPKGEPAFDLTLGRRDPLRKSVYGQIGGDTTILALPDSILEAMPLNAFAFRDRTLLSIPPTEFASVTIEHGRSIVEVAAPLSVGGKGLHWTLTEPLKAPADESAVTSMLLTLGHLRAEAWESSQVGSGGDYGLDAPTLRVKWRLQGGKSSTAATPKVLRIGKAKPNDGALYANIEGDSDVFTLNPQVVSQFEAEFHDHQILKFTPDDVERLVLAWPSRTISLEKQGRAPGQAPSWAVSPGYDPGGFNLGQTSAILKTLSNLKTPRFLQYTGPIPDQSGLSPPGVSVTLRLKASAKPTSVILRVGNAINPSNFVATTAIGHDGPVFVLAADDCKSFLTPPTRPGDLPADVFAPEPQAEQTAPSVPHRD